MIKGVFGSRWEKYKEIGNHGLGHYDQAIFVAKLRAMERIKLSRTSFFSDWVSDAIDFAQNLVGVGKFRDIVPSLMAFADYGLVWFRFNGRKATNEEIDDYDKWKEITVELTPKGYLATENEWYKQEEITHPYDFLSCFYIDKDAKK